MVRCSVLGCKSDSERKIPDLSFHSFPDNDIICRKWIEATGRTNWTAKKSSRICSRHFEQNVFVKKKKLTVLLPNAVPLLEIKTFFPTTSFSVSSHMEGNIKTSIPTTLSSQIDEHHMEIDDDSNAQIDLIKHEPAVDQPNISSLETWALNKTTHEPAVGQLNNSKHETRALNKTRETIPVAKVEMLKQNLLKKLEKKTLLSEVRRKKLAVLRTKTWRLKQKTSALTNVMKDLKKHSLIDEETAKLFSSIDSVLRDDYVTKKRIKPIHIQPHLPSEVVIEATTQRTAPSVAKQNINVPSTSDAPIRSKIQTDDESTQESRLPTLDPSSSPGSLSTVSADENVYKCHMCCEDIIGFRYTCVQCADFQWCSACEELQAHDTHYVLRIPGNRSWLEVSEMLRLVRAEVARAWPDLQQEPEIIKTELDIELDSDPLLEEFPQPSPDQSLESIDVKDETLVDPLFASCDDGATTADQEVPLTETLHHHPTTTTHHGEASYERQTTDGATTLLPQVTVSIGAQVSADEVEQAYKPQSQRAAQKGLTIEIDRGHIRMLVARKRKHSTSQQEMTSLPGPPDEPPIAGTSCSYEVFTHVTHPPPPKVGRPKKHS